MKTKQILLIISTILLVNTTISHGQALVEAHFSKIIQSNGKSVNFLVSNDPDAVKYYWNFGDGKDTAMLINSVNHTYNKPGVYNACLTITDSLGGKDSYCENIIAEDSIAKASKRIQSYDVDFSALVDTTLYPYKVTFTNFIPDTPNISFFWDMGDGKTFAEKNPIHGYSKKGTYRVTLAARDLIKGQLYIKTNFIKVGTPNCRASFKFSVSNDTLRLFNTSSSNLDNYYWNFGDALSSSDENPVHKFTSNGIYNLVFVAWDGTDTSSCMDYAYEQVRIGNVFCNASFNYFADSVTNIVNFRSNSLGDFGAVKHSWVFGDGSESNDINPVHQFSKPGIYPVTMATYNQLTNCIDFKKEYIKIGNTKKDFEADFEEFVEPVFYNVKFQNRSIGDSLNYYWTFGDGDTSTKMHPVHHYDQGGYYNVCLNAFRNKKQNISCKSIRVLESGQNIDAEKQCKADFIPIIDSSLRKVTCVNKSFGENINYNWIFYEIGIKSTAKDPIYSYPTPGYYKVSLKVANTLGSKCVSLKYALLNVGMGNQGIRVNYGYRYDSVSRLNKATGYPVDFIGISHGDAAKLKWSFGDDTYDSTTVNPTHKYDLISPPDTFNACLEIWDEITGDYDKYCELVVVDVFSSESIGEVSITSGAELTVYPNPVEKEANIDYTLPNDGNVEIYLLESDGTIIYTLTSGYQSKGNYQIKLKPGNLPAGSYFVQMLTSNGKTAKKLLFIK